MQGEEIYKIICRRRSLTIRWEMIALGIAAALLGLMKFWFYLLFPGFQFSEINSAFVKVIISMITVGSLLDIAYIFAAGIFFVRAFQIQNGPQEKSNRIEKTAHNKIYVGHPLPPSPELSEMLEQEGICTEDSISGIISMKDEEVKNWLQKLVPNYIRNNS